MKLSVGFDRVTLARRTVVRNCRRRVLETPPGSAMNEEGTTDEIGKSVLC